ncbi:sensor histidine kinase [Halocalculus aciditolerans]|uniref:histidine kinase n=1 Tax=Halocalculus aciditolerans TaxID=1383812 RepID=A0A830FE47_9EURY|nr:HAMP domain-containing sensor histidine kinase [Halocalculus aciditolerans]GGL65746.1 hypothetical protein GCM10009039_24540 [Halocalculus aciditolerans]
MFSAMRRRAAALIVAATGGLLLLFPLFDIWDDVANPPIKPLWTTLAENAIGVLLAGLLFAGGLWLYRRDWEDAYVTDAALWVVAIVAAHGLVMVWIVGIQRYLQHDLKPYIIALDAVVLSADTALAIGVYDARNRRKRDELSRERDRLDALYENSVDPLATVRFADAPVVVAANDAFTDRFGDRVDRVLDAVPDSQRGDTLRETFETASTVEYEWAGVDGDRDYLVTVTPMPEGDDPRAHVRVADITEQQRLAREEEARERVEHLHRVAVDLAAVADEASAFERTLNALRSTVAFDAACVVVDGDLVAGRSTTDVLDRDAIESVQPDAVPGDGGALTHTTADGRTVLTVPIGDDAVIQAGVDGDITDSQVTAAELLGTHLREARRRLAREDRLREQRERLELLNRTFRHDLLNDVNVVDARVTILDDHVDADGQPHLHTVAQRTDEMHDRIQTMRSLMQAVEDDDHELTAVPLAPTVKTQVSAARDEHPDAAFEIDTPLPDVDVRADDLLGDVIENLLSNAVEHNDTDPAHVDVSATHHTDTVALTVADNGPGVHPDRRDAVFDLGERGDRSHGTGVGLHICQRIVDSYGGHIDVTDADDLGGAAFTIHLPTAS